jgi:hypothetical protein
VSIRHSSGISKLSLAKLPPDLQKRFGYDPTKATEHHAQEVAVQEQARKADARRRQTEALWDPKKAIPIEIKDLKNFPDKYSGRTVKLTCIIGGFKRISDGKQAGNFQLTAEGMVIRETTDMEKLNGGSEYQYRHGDGDYLLGFLIVPKDSKQIVSHCHESMGGLDHFWAHVYARIFPNGEKEFLGEVFRIEVFSQNGKVYKTISSKPE